MEISRKPCLSRRTKPSRRNRWSYSKLRLYTLSPKHLLIDHPQPCGMRAMGENPGRLRLILAEQSVGSPQCGQCMFQQMVTTFLMSFAGPKINEGRYQATD